MKGVVKYARGDGYVDLRDVEEIPPPPNQVKIEVKASGICGSDLHIFHDKIKIPIRVPVVIGHEFSGVVVEKGAEVGDEIKIGDRVTGEPSIEICGKCRYCRSEYYNLCSDRKVLGYWFNGCFTRYCNVTFVHKLPDNVSFEAGAMTELLACCVHGVIEQTGISAGDFVAITGPGPVGLFAAQVALAEGGVVMVCGTSVDQHRLKLAEELGVHHVLNIDEDDSIKRVKELTEGYGADVVLECSGFPAAARIALDLVRKQGKYTQMGLFGGPIEIDFEKIAFKEIQVTGFVSQRRPAWKRALSLMGRGVIQGEKLISHRFPLDEWREAFDLFERREGIKLVLIP
ncbi:MAG: zinc-binding dehydrogenase [Syntrophaceae bacterium]|nr:zinc-binding dehydrogenase [Syntrophaceae bacterium]